MSKTKIKSPEVVQNTQPYLSRHLQNVGVDKLYLLDCLGQGWSFASLDNGMAKHNQWIDSAPRIIRRSFVTNSPDPFLDNNNHGTCISSLLIGGPTTLAGQETVGCCPKFENYYHAKVMSDNGNIILDDVIKALDWLISLTRQGIGPDIVNMSFGEHFDKPWADDILGINQRMQTLWDENKTLFFVAAGNHGSRNGQVSWLSELPFTICVGAINYNNSLGYLSPISPYIDLVDYGIGIKAYHKNGFGYQTFDGTSQSCPIAASKAGAIGSWFTKTRGLPKQSVKENFMNLFKRYNFIKDLGEPGCDTTFGCGQIQFTL